MLYRRQATRGQIALARDTVAQDAALPEGMAQRARALARQVLGICATVGRHAPAVLTAYLATRMAVLATVFVSSITIPAAPGVFPSPRLTDLALNGLVRWDSFYYSDIAIHGYILHRAAFFPFYPLLVRVLSPVAGNPFVAGLLISNGAFLVALGYLYALTRREYGEAAAGRTVFYLAAAPAAVFFSAMYTESLFVLLATATFYHARAGQWTRAAVAGILAAATRNTGVVLAIAVALETLQQGGISVRPSTWRPGLWHKVPGLWRGLLAATVIPMGLLAYMLYLAHAFGDPLAFVHAQAAWGKGLTGVNITGFLVTTLILMHIGPHVLAGQIDAPNLINTLLTLAFVPLVIFVARRMRLMYGAYVVLTLLITLSGGTGTVSMVRFVLMLVPCYMLVGVAGRRIWLDRLIVALSLPLMAYLAVTFSHWYRPV